MGEIGRGAGKRSVVSDGKAFEIECQASPDHPLALWIEPWGDRVDIPVGRRAFLRFNGDLIESVVIEWMDNALLVGVPRFSILRVLDQGGALVRDYDTHTLPPVPDGTRPI